MQKAQNYRPPAGCGATPLSRSEGSARTHLELKPAWSAPLHQDTDIGTSAVRSQTPIHRLSSDKYPKQCDMLPLLIWSSQMAGGLKGDSSKYSNNTTQSWLSQGTGKPIFFQNGYRVNFQLKRLPLSYVFGCICNSAISTRPWPRRLEGPPMYLLQENPIRNYPS